jgi:hypothetical protein
MLLILTVLLSGTAFSISAEENGKGMLLGNGRAYSPLGLFLARESSLPPQSKRSVTPVRAQGSAQAKGWRGITPLRSTRQDVERLIGRPITTGGSAYQTSSEHVYVQYSDGPCEKGWPYGWNVVPNTVVTISVSPKKTLPLASLNLDETKYEKSRDSHISSKIYYTNREEGIAIEADEFWGNVISVNYIPTAAQIYLQCPDASRRLPPGRRQADSLFKFDELVDIPSSYERERLDLFAAEIKRQRDADAYIIAYGGVVAHAGEAKTRADCAKEYLIQKHRLKAENIWAIDGGYRESRIMEIYVEPRGGDLPLARPTVRPSKVKIIQVRKSSTPSVLVNRPTRLAKPNDVKIHFVFHPTDPTRVVIEKSLVLVVRKDGRAEALLYDRDQSQVVATYKGRLSRAILQGLVTRIGKAIVEAKNRKLDDSIIRESDLFYLSIKNGTVNETSGKVEDMPEDVRRLIGDLSLVWKRFKESPSAAAYVKAELIEREKFESLRQKGDEKFASVEDFPPEMRKTILDSIIYPGIFYQLSQAQYGELRNQRRLVIHNGSAYFLNLFTSRRENNQESQREEIRFSFHPRWREQVQEDVFLTINADGKADAVFNDYDGTSITGVYEGKLPKAEVSRMSAKIRAVLRQTKKPESGNGVIREGDLFYLSVIRKTGAVEQRGGVVERVPEVRPVIEELRALLKRLRKTPLSHAYIRAASIENDRLPSLLKEGKLRFISFHDFPRELQSVVRNALNKSFGFIALNQSQYDQLKTYTTFGELYVTEGSTGYKLTLLPSQDRANRKV